MLQSFIKAALMIAAVSGFVLESQGSQNPGSANKFAENAKKLKELENAKKQNKAHFDARVRQGTLGSCTDKCINIKNLEKFCIEKGKGTQQEWCKKHCDNHYIMLENKGRLKQLDTYTLEAQCHDIEVGRKIDRMGSFNSLEQKQPSNTQNKR